jgi:hypothetical protein
MLGVLQRGSEALVRLSAQEAGSESTALKYLAALMPFASRMAAMESGCGFVS